MGLRQRWPGRLTRRKFSAGRGSSSQTTPAYRSSEGLLEARLDRGWIDFDVGSGSGEFGRVEQDFVGEFLPAERFWKNGTQRRITHQLVVVQRLRISGHQNERYTRQHDRRAP